MDITYTYDIQELRCEPSIGNLSKVITEVVFEYVAECTNGVTSRLPGLVTLTEPDEDSFTPIDDISEETIITWIEASSDITLAKKMLDDQIKYKSGFIYKGASLPWNTNTLED